MIELTINEAITTCLVGLGVLLNLLALYESTRPARPRAQPPIFTRECALTPDRTTEISAAFEAAAAFEPPAEHGDVYEITEDHIRPGELLKTVRIPPFVQSFKNRAKRSPQAYCKV